MEQKQSFISRLYFDIVFRFVKYRSLFLAIVFGFFALVSFQYWRQISQPITRGYSETTVENIQIIMSSPDKLYIGESYPGKIDFEVVYESEDVESEDIDVSIKWKSTDKNLAYAQPLNFKLNSSSLEERSSLVYYRRTDSANPTAEFVAEIKVGDNTKTLSRSVSISRAPSETIAPFSSVVAAILTIFSLVDQVRKLFGNKG